MESHVCKTQIDTCKCLKADWLSEKSLKKCVECQADLASTVFVLITMSYNN